MLKSVETSYSQQQMPSSFDSFRLFTDRFTVGGASYDIPLGARSTLKTGGRAACVFTPKRTEDLVAFRQWNASQKLPLQETILGGLSNVLIRDGGLEGVVIRLPSAGTWAIEGTLFIFDAGLPNASACEVARRSGFSGLEFLAGIPGTIGGAIAMNAGAYGREVGERLVWVDLLTSDGQIVRTERAALSMRYRQGGLPSGALVLKAAFCLTADSVEAVTQRQAQELAERRKKIHLTSTVGTAGSAFKNPEGHKAWQLIEAVGGRGLQRDGAMFSNEHANFLLNTGGATAAALEGLGEEVRRRVRASFGVELEWEIKILGNPA